MPKFYINTKLSLSPAKMDTHMAKFDEDRLQRRKNTGRKSKRDRFEMILNEERENERQKRIVKGAKKMLCKFCRDIGKTCPEVIIASIYVI